MSARIEQTAVGFLVTRDGAPVPPQAYPPALLIFEKRTHARKFAAAINADDHSEAHRVIEQHGNWWTSP